MNTVDNINYPDDDNDDRRHSDWDMGMVHSQNKLKHERYHVRGVTLAM